MPDTSYDVAIIGGALSGASLALLLRRWRPETRVAIVERREAFDHKVGEATVEVSARFLEDVLGLGGLLEREHLPKHGLRFWFTDRPGRSLFEMSEAGPFEAPAVPSYQLDRSRLDERVLELAAAEGAVVIRPAKIAGVEPGWPESRLEIDAGCGAEGGRRSIAVRWVVDASGRHAVLARRARRIERVDSHPTAAAWARWRGVVDLDSPEMLGPGKLPAIAARRRLATNHFCGPGWWCWMIPLAGGATSVGLVWDRRRFELPRNGSLAASYRDFVRAQAGLRELLAGAEMIDGDFRAYGNLAYRAERYMGRGWALVGDAASFIDPYYSPGLDHVAISVYSTARLIEAELGGTLADAELERRIEIHNERFGRSYERWLAALYDGKYGILGDAEITTAAFLLDTSLYYLGVVNPIYRDREAFLNPILGLEGRGARVAYALLRGINRRLQVLAETRRRRGIFGRRNVGWRSYSPSFRLGPAGVGRHLLRGLRIWGRAELHTLGHRLFKSAALAAPAAGPEPASRGR